MSKDGILKAGQDSKTNTAGDPRQIGRYPILKRLGKGGMGVVYAAYDDELDRRIAIKLLIRRDEAQDQRARARIRREAQAMARLSDPSVVHVYEVGEWQGLTYVAMEYVRGETLKTWLRTPRSLAERIDVLRQAAQGLVAAHQAGVVHRDFKPDNVMVDKRGRVRVLDFGLAQANDEEKIEQTLESIIPALIEKPGAFRVELTQEGAVMGTPAYMSLEQHMGKPTTPATDQYSFCVVAYEVLYGIRPFIGANRVEIAISIFQNMLNPPSEGHGVPAAVYPLLLRGLAKDPGDRWPSMEALVDAMEGALGSQRRRRLVVVALVCLSIVLTVSLSIAMTRSRPVALEIDPFTEIARSAEMAAARARWVYPNAEQPLDTALVWVQRLEDDGREEDAQRLRQDFGRALLRLGDRYWEQANGRLVAEDFYLQALLFDESLVQAQERSDSTPEQRADMRARALAGELTTHELRKGDDLALIIEIENEGVDASVIMKKLSEINDRFRAEVAEVDPAPEVVQTPPSIAESVDEPKVDVGPMEESQPLDSRKKAKALVESGNRLRSQARPAEAKRKFKKALELDRRNAGAYAGLGMLHFDAGRYQDAARHLEKATKYKRRNNRYWLYLGDAYKRLKKKSEASQAYQKAKMLGNPVAVSRLSGL